MRSFGRVASAIGALTAVMALASAIGPAGAAAQDEVPLQLPERLQVVTDYPAVAVEAGDTVTFDVQVLAPDRRDVALEIVDPPEGWTMVLRGGGFVISGVTAAPEAPPETELEITVPPDAEPGTYDFGLEGRGGGQTDMLELTVTVADTAVGGIVLTTDFATLRGRPTDTFRYDLEITNQRPEEITFAFDAAGPEGWTVTAGPASEERAATVTVGAGESESVRVEADPPSAAPAGSYPIEVRAMGGGQSGTFTLTAEVTGQASLALVTPDGRLDLDGEAGDSTEATLVIVNEGTAPLEDVQLTTDPPVDWSVELAPDTIPIVEAGASQEVTIRVRPSGDAVAGDYVIGVTASGSGESTDLAYRFTVETSRWWGAIGIAIIVAAFVVLLVVFRRFGRR